MLRQERGYIVHLVLVDKVEVVITVMFRNFVDGIGFLPSHYKVKVLMMNSTAQQ